MDVADLADPVSRPGHAPLAFPRAAGPSSPLRVLDVTNFYSPTSGGVKTYLDAKARHLFDRGVVHAMAIPGKRSDVRTLRASRVHHVPAPALPFSPGYRFMLSARTLGDVLAAESPDIIEVGSPFLLPGLVRAALAGREVPTVGFYHSDLVRTYIDTFVRSLGKVPAAVGRGLVRRYVRRVYGRFDASVVASSSIASELRAWGVRRVVTIPLGVDLDTFHPRHRRAEVRGELGIPSGVPMALYAGRLMKEKGVDALLEAQARLPAQERPWIVLAGEGPLRGALERQAVRRDRLTVLGYVEDTARLARLYASADLYVAPGPAETFGLSIAEALASGLPVVGVDSGAGPERVRGGRCSELYHPGSAASCAAAIRRLTRRLGPELRRRARRHAESAFSWSRTFDALLGLYGRLLEERRSCGRTVSGGW